MAPETPITTGSRTSVECGILVSVFVVSALLLAGLGASSARAAYYPAEVFLRSTAVADWANVTSSLPTAPPMDLWANLVYDPAQENLVLFGGCTVAVCPVAAQTWTFAHDHWTNVTSDSAQPPARGYATLAYDSADGYAVLFGGGGQSTVLGDTWTYAAGHWSNVTASSGSGPSARGGASMAYDPVVRGIVLFGGVSTTGAALNDTWFFRNGMWSRATTAVSPLPRYEASMVWDGVDSELVLVDGCGASACPLNDSWRYAAGVWSPLPRASGESPPPRYLEAMTFDASRGVVRLFGGLGNTASLGDTWEYAHDQWTQVFPADAPRAREGSATPESTEAWLSNGTRHVLPYSLLWGGDWVSCADCPLRGLEDTWVFESPPHVMVTPPGSAIAGEATAFRAVVSDGTPPFTYSWDFGDGSAGVGSNITHAFAAAGEYSVILGVRDDAGVLATASYPLSVGSQGGLVLTMTLALPLVAGVVVAVTLALWVARRRRRPPS